MAIILINTHAREGIARGPRANMYAALSDIVWTSRRYSRTLRRVNLGAGVCEVAAPLGRGAEVGGGGGGGAAEVGGSKVRGARARSVMWTNKQCKTMLTHVFKPRWLVLILLSAENRRREKESEVERGRTLVGVCLCTLRARQRGGQMRRVSSSFSFSLSGFRALDLRTMITRSALEVDFVKI